MKENYPEWKIIAWRFLRVSIAGGISTFLSFGLILNQDLTNIDLFAKAFLAAMLTGAINALGVVVRQTWGNEDKTSLVDKIII